MGAEEGGQAASAAGGQRCARRGAAEGAPARGQRLRVETEAASDQDGRQRRGGRRGRGGGGRGGGRRRTAEGREATQARRRGGGGRGVGTDRQPTVGHSASSQLPARRGDDETQLCLRRRDPAGGQRCPARLCARPRKLSARVT